MRTLERNKRKLHYCLLTGKTAILDEWGNETGEYTPVYSEAVEMWANISAATGADQVEQFGGFLSYDKVIVTDDLACPIDEYAVLFIDKAPSYGTDGAPLYDYVVRRVAKSLNSVSIAVSKVVVS